MTTQRLSLNVTTREKTGKGANRKLRATGLVPGVFYTTDGSSLPVQAKEADLNKLYLKVGRTTLFTLNIEGSGKSITKPCLVWDAEYHPTRNSFQHIDFYGVDLDKELKIRVPLEFSGTAKGTKLGGKLEVYREHILVLSKAETLPNKIIVDISNLDINQGLRVADLVMPQGVRASYDDNFAILLVNAPGASKDDDDDIK